MAARELLARGYGNVKVLLGGIAAWKDAGYPLVEAGTPRAVPTGAP